MEEKTIIYSLETIRSIVEELYAIMPDCSVVTFTGTLGAGKTTLVQHLLRRCGITGVITSPTFAYLNTYINQEGQTFYHFDLYRMRSLEDFLNAGFDEYLYQPNSWALIEWPEIIMPLLTHNVCHVSITYHDSQRRLTYKKIG
jgi:tRNA threonylcarbamoyladenosine biosynthesis protein TsaE